MNEEVRIVFEYGVLGEISSDRHFSVISPYWNEEFVSYDLFLKKYDLSPVCHLCRNPSLKGKEFVIILTIGDSGGITETSDKEQELRAALSHMASKSASAFQVLFYFGAMYYHLSCLIKAYADMATLVFDMLKIRGKKMDLESTESFAQRKLSPRWISHVPVPKMGIMDIGADSAEVVYYEMMAYLFSTRSLFDSLMPILNLLSDRGKTFKGSFNDFMKNLDKCALSIDLKDFLIKNRTWTSKLRDYRDCVVHAMFPSPSPLPSSMIAIFSECGMIALQTWLPDNPEIKPKRSPEQYSFDQRIEYLSYAHTTYLKTLDFLIHLVRYVNDNTRAS